MELKPLRQNQFTNRLFTIVSGLGFMVMFIGLGLDLLPGSSPGISFPQLMLILGGLTLFIFGWVFRNPTTRQRIRQDLIKNLAIVSIITLITLLALEAGLTIANVKTRYPAVIPDEFLKAVPWWTCDESGCHYDYENMLVACQNKEVSGRRCMVNRQGFHDSQDFVIADDIDDMLRILMLGDSFTFGGTAKIGYSFVETLKNQLPEAIIWNTGIPGAGTNQALETLKTYAPILNPQIVILGFFINDFEDNVYPIDSYFMGMDDNKYPLAIRQYMLDDVGNVSKLDSQRDLYYRYQQIDPPTSELQRVVGTTRLGSLALNTFGAISNMIHKVDGKRINTQVEFTRRYLTELRDYTQDNDIALFILLIPRREDIPSAGTLLKHALQIFQDLKIPYFDVRDILDADVDYAPQPDIHWSTEGHQTIGLILAQCLEQFQNSNMISNCETLIFP